MRLISPLRVDADEMRIWELALKDGPSKILEQRLHERQILQETRSSLLVQLRTKNDLIGVLSLAEPASGQFNTEELSLLKSLSGQLALVLENTKLLQRLVEHERLRAQLAVAAEVQRGLLPAVNPTLPGVDLCAFCQPALHVGGDYYDFVSLPDGSVAICVADVAGKGIAAALLMAVVQASLRSRLSDTREHSVAEVAAVLNRHICASVSEARYVTCFYGELNTRDGSFRFVNAGHNPPILLRARHAEETGLLPELHRLSVGGTVLGLFPDLSFEEGRVSLQPGDILVAFTDGVTEAMNLQGEEFSDERLCEVIRNVSSRRASDILESIVSRVSEWAKGAVPHDDITVVVLALK
jgi:sigma-B regulation protein RsbU (phosphoserine phosphatase)